MVTIETADNALKTFYLDAVSDALDMKANPLLAQFSRSTSDVAGKDVKKLVRVGMNGGIAAGTETGDLPAAKGNDYVTFTVPLKNLYGTIEISDKAIRASSNNEGAFVNLLNDEMETLVKSASLNFGRMLFGDGTGALGKVLSYSGTTVKFDTVKNIVEGMVLEFYMDGFPVPDNPGRRVLSVDRSVTGSSVTFEGSDFIPASMVEGAIAYLKGSKDKEITGLGAIFADTDTLYGAQRTKLMTPYKKKNVGVLTESDLQAAIDSIEECTGSKINFIVCSSGVRRALAEELQNRQMFTTEELKGGHKCMTFNGIPIVSDRFCPAGTMYLLNTNDFKIHQLCDWQWLEGEDGKVLKQIPGKPVYTATLVKYAELMCERPGGQGVLLGINEI
ncbi:MAG: phage major capsid protein [Clostridia bacterium]|nr:phage major capsid protein [Clostridia bacterium]